MKVVVVGGGPAGLYAAILLKRLNPSMEIDVFEQNPADVTWGFGVVFSHEALAFLRSDDPETADLIEPAMESWSDIAVNHRGAHIVIDGVGFRAIGRLQLLQLLQQRAAGLGIRPHFGKCLENIDDAGNADLVIGADGLNSIVRAEAPEVFGEKIEYLGNRFVWYGASKPFDVLTQTFKSSRFGPFNAHHYRYGPDKSTFIVECSEETFTRAGFDKMIEPEYRAICQEIFADTLDGGELIDNNSHWRRFPVLSCKIWHNGNRVLVGDALHTAHYSIGSGTRLALEDVISLVRALQENDFDVARALPAYQAKRQPVLNKLVAAAGASSQWYEQFGEKMHLGPWQFALSYILRAGRIDASRLRELAPRFASDLLAQGIELESVA